MLKSIHYKGQRLLYRVHVRQDHYLKVQLIYPLRYCPVSSAITGPARQGISFRGDYGQKAIERKIIRSYRIAEIIAGNKDRLLGVYLRYLDERTALEEVNDPEIRERINGKLKDWFFHSLLVPGVTGLHCPYSERDYVIRSITNRTK